MRTNDTMLAKGFVDPSFINLKTGERVPWNNRHNTLTYLSAEAMAAAFGGKADYIPTHIGIIYGSADSSRSGETLGSTFDRDQDWDNLGDELSKIGADVQVRSFSYSPSVTPTDEDVYRKIGGNAVTFHSCSDSSTGGSFDHSFIFIPGMNIYQAVLLNVKDERKDPLILARVSLNDKSSSSPSYYRSKPENFEVALDWTVKFF